MIHSSMHFLAFSALSCLCSIFCVLCEFSKESAGTLLFLIQLKVAEHICNEHMFWKIMYAATSSSSLWTPGSVCCYSGALELRNPHRNRPYCPAFPVTTPAIAAIVLNIRVKSTSKILDSGPGVMLDRGPSAPNCSRLRPLFLGAFSSCVVGVDQNKRSHRAAVVVVVVHSSLHCRFQLHPPCFQCSNC